MNGDRVLGRIPWSAAQAYSHDELGFGPRMRSVFWRIVHAIDEEYLLSQANEYKRAAALRDAAAKTGGGKRTRSRRPVKRRRSSRGRR